MDTDDFDDDELLLLKLEEEEHIVIAGAPPSSELEGLLRVRILMLLSKKTIQPGRVRSRVRKTPTLTAIAYHAERFR
jgi:hypothetical protein